MGSFKTVLNNIVSELQNNATLKAFCASRWNKPLTVKAVFRKRTEVSLQEFPIILVTRPSVVKNFLTNTNRNTLNTLRLYLLFHQPDPLKGAEELIEAEEILDDALTIPDPETLGAMSIKPGASINDEGANHPEYGLVLEVEVKHRR